MGDSDKGFLQVQLNNRHCSNLGQHPVVSTGKTEVGQGQFPFPKSTPKTTACHPDLAGHGTALQEGFFSHLLWE